MYAKTKVDDDFKKMYIKMRTPDIEEETVFQPPKPYLFFGENITLIDENEAASVAEVSLHVIQKRGHDGTMTKIKVEKNGKMKYYFLKHECENLKNEKEKKKIAVPRKQKKEKATRAIS